MLLKFREKQVENGSEFQLEFTVGWAHELRF